MKKIIAESLGKEIEVITRSLEALHEILDLAEIKGFNCEDLARGRVLVTEGLASLTVAKLRLARERGERLVVQKSVRDLVEGALGTLNLIALEWIGESPLPGEQVLNFRVLRKEGNEYALAAKLKVDERTFVMVGTMEEIEETFKIPGHA